jgi:hypothetical protein
MSRISIAPDDEEIPIYGPSGISSDTTAAPSTPAPTPPPLNIGGMLISPLATKNTNPIFGPNVHSMADDRVKIFTHCTAS